MSLNPEHVRKAGDWAEAIKIIDATELALRDLIERELAPVAILSGNHIKTAAIIANTTARLLRKIKKLRGDAFKEAFRYLRDCHAV